MNLDELRAVQNKERQKDSLQHLRESFYADVAEYVSELEEQRNTAAERADDPFASPEVRQLTDEIETARDVTEAIYQRRLGKLVKRASLAAADMPTDAEGLTKEEQALHDDLVDRIVENKDRVLDVVAGDVESAVDVESPDADGTESGANAADVMGAGGSPADATSDPRTGGEAGSQTPEADPDAPTSASGRDPDPEPPSPPEESEGSDGSPDGRDSRDTSPTLDDRTTVRITDDVGEIFGVDDRSYDLSAEDVVTLPAANAEPLLERDAAERVE